MGVVKFVCLCGITLVEVDDSYTADETSSGVSKSMLCGTEELLCLRADACEASV